MSVIRTLFHVIPNRVMPALLLVGALVGVWFAGQTLERPVYDVLTRWSAKPATDSPVVMVLIDDESLVKLKERFGSPPWPRSVYQDIFQRIQLFQPAQVVFDGHFLDLEQTDDAAVFELMRSIPHLISGLAVSSSRLLNTSTPQYYRLNLGVLNMPQDGDGVVRRLAPMAQVRIHSGQMGIFPALSVATALAVFEQQSPYSPWVLDQDSQHLMLLPEGAPEQVRQYPLDAHGYFWLRWYRLLPSQDGNPRQSHRSIPLWQLYAETAEMTRAKTQPDATPVGLTDKAGLKDKIILLGSSATMYRDYHPSPMALRHLGVDMHATAIDNLLSGQTVRPLPAGLTWVILLGLFALIFCLRLRLESVGQTLLYTLGTMVLYLWVSYILLQSQGVYLPVVTPELFMLVAFLSGSTFRVMLKDRQVLLLEQSLSKLVSQSVYREIQRLSHEIKQGGQRLEITSMFVDIRNFTRLAETLPPHLVTELLNEFYTVVVDVIFAHRGTVDKFMGDGILIMFGAPLPTDQHRELAFEAAQAVYTALQTLMKKWTDERQLSVEFGISLSSGPAFVGFFGPANKLEYTAVGDTVNLCVRLQEQSKQLGAPLIFSEYTVAPFVSHIPELVSLGPVTVRGREGTLQVFTLEHVLGRDALGQGPGKTDAPPTGEALGE